MKAVFYILFGWMLTSAAAWALGSVLFARLRIKLNRFERVPLAFATGSALLSALVFLLCAVHLVYKPAFLAVAVLAIAAAVRFRPPAAAIAEEQRLPRFWVALFLVISGVFTYLYFFHALAPEISPDGTAYHVALPARYYRAHGFRSIPFNMYANLTQGIELLFLFAFAFGRHSAAAMVHFSFLLALPWLMIAYARRIGFPIAGLAGAAFVYVSPIVGVDGSSAYVDVALAAVVFALFYFLQLWDRERENVLLIPIGILGGFAFAVKYTGFVAVLYALGFVGWKLWRAKARVLQPVAVTAAVAAAMIVPWLVKNWIVVKDPIAPFATRIFPNRFIHVSFERDYTAWFRHYGLKSYGDIPAEVAVRGDVLNGVIGPLIYLSPLALLALRWRAGRQLLLAAAVFGVTYFSNIATRFLIPALPFIMLSLALVLSHVRALLAVLLVLHAILSWPDVLQHYCRQWTWRLEGPPVAAALRKEPEGIYLTTHWPGYNIDQMIDLKVPPGEKVFAFTQISEAYTTHDVLVSYQAAPNEVLADILLTPMFADFQPNMVRDYRFPERDLQRIRVVQTAPSPGVNWSIAELRLFDRGSELPRDPKWLLTAKPNPWDVQLAFDNAVVTRWKSWQMAEPGMYLEVNLGGPRKVDTVRTESVADMQIRMKVEGMDASGKWIVLSENHVETPRRIVRSLRFHATEELKRRGIHYFVLDPGDTRADDFIDYSRFWGITQIAERGGVRLYRID